MRQKLSDFEKLDIPSTAPHTKPIGTVLRSVHAPEPYDTESNQVLGRLRARLFTLLETSVSPGPTQELAKTEVRRATLDAWDDLRSIMNRIAATDGTRNGHGD